VVEFRELDPKLISWYLDSEEWRERAGGYAIQGRGAALVAAIEGDYLNVVGLPVAHLLLASNATVTICHSRTRDLAGVTRQADVLVAAIGRPGFLGSEHVKPGATVIDVYPGDGDWTRLFSDIVGSQGRVYSFVPAEVADFKDDPVGRMRTLAQEPGRENVEAVSADLVAMPEATQPADVLWLHLFYHDLHTALLQKKGATAADFNRAVYERLKPGGSYVIVDHAAAVGAGTSDAQSLHRIEPASVREEVEAAGFVLDAESTMLANKDDPHSIKVFDPSIKGETDRFAYRFVKP